MLHRRPTFKSYCLTFCYTLAMLKTDPRSGQFWPQIGSCNAMESVLEHGSTIHEDPARAEISSQDSSENENEFESLFPDNLDLLYDDFVSAPASTADPESAAFIMHPATRSTALRSARIPDVNAQYVQHLSKDGLQSLWSAFTTLPLHLNERLAIIPVIQSQAKVLLQEVLNAIGRLLLMKRGGLKADHKLEEILRKLKMCLSILRQVAMERKSWQKQHELLIFNALIYLFAKDIANREKILGFLCEDGVIYHTALHIDNMIGPMEFLSGHEFQASWEETLRKHTKLGHLRAFLDRFNEDAWSHLLCYFLNHRYTKKKLHDNGSNTERFQEILRRLGRLRYGQLPQTPTKFLIESKFMADIIQLFDSPTPAGSEVIKNDVDCYIATYHLLDYVIRFAHPQTIRYVTTAKLLTNRILSKRESIRRILNVAEQIRDHHFNIKTTKKFEKTLNSYQVQPKSLTSRIKFLESTYMQLNSHAQQNFRSLRNVPPPSHEKDPELTAWLNSSDIILYLLETLRREIQQRKVQYDRYQLWRMNKASSRASKFASSSSN